jgi:hypothetical protein
MTQTSSAVELASISLNPGAIDISSFGSFLPSLSADGRVVAFESDVHNLVPDDTNGTIRDVFVCDLHDPLNPTTTLVSRNSNGAVGAGISLVATLAADGLSVAFLSQATNLVDDDFNATTDVFWHSLVSGKTIRASVNTAHQEAIGTASPGIALTGDGREVFFGDQASNLVGGDSNGKSDVFVRGPIY